MCLGSLIMTVLALIVPAVGTTFTVEHIKPKPKALKRLLADDPTDVITGGTWHAYVSTDTGKLVNETATALTKVLHDGFAQLDDAIHGTAVYVGSTFSTPRAATHVPIPVIALALRTLQVSPSSLVALQADDTVYVFDDLKAAQEQAQELAASLLTRRTGQLFVHGGLSTAQYVELLGELVSQPGVILYDRRTNSQVNPQLNGRWRTDSDVRQTNDTTAAATHDGQRSEDMSGFQDEISPAEWRAIRYRMGQSDIPGAAAEQSVSNVDELINWIEYVNEVSAAKLPRDAKRKIYNALMNVPISALPINPNAVDGFDHVVEVVHHLSEHAGNVIRENAALKAEIDRRDAMLASAGELMLMMTEAAQKRRGSQE